MNDPQRWKVPKWLFIASYALLLAVADLIVQRAAHPLGHWEIVTVAACVALGAILGVTPFILDYRAIVKVVEASALGSIADKIQNLEKLAAQISAATNEWTNAQVQAENTATGAREITDRMAEEVRQFSEFMQKMNDSEKSALRLEIEKLRRGEGEWLQVLVRLLDHVFLLHAAAARSGQPKLAEQITRFQAACHDTARRIGLLPFVVEAGEPFDTARHQLAGGETSPSAGAVVAETAALGFNFQGRLLRPALVRLRETPTSEGSAPAEPSAPEDSAPVQPTESEDAAGPPEKEDPDPSLVGDNPEHKLPLGSAD